MMNENQLLKLKREVEEAKTSISELKGHLSALMTQLKNDWKCGSIEDAEKKLKSLKKEIDTLDEQIQTGITKLEEEYDV